MTTFRWKSASRATSVPELYRHSTNIRSGGYIDAGVPITINTDDPALFRTSLHKEYAIARDRFGISDRADRERLPLCARLPADKLLERFEFLARFRPTSLRRQLPVPAKVLPNRVDLAGGCRSRRAEPRCLLWPVEVAGGGAPAVRGSCPSVPRALAHRCRDKSRCSPSPARPSSIAASSPGKTGYRSARRIGTCCRSAVPASGRATPAIPADSRATGLSRCSDPSRSVSSICSGP